MRSFVRWGKNFCVSQFYDPQIVFVRSRRMQSRRSRCTIHARNFATGTRLPRLTFGRSIFIEHRKHRSVSFSLVQERLDTWLITLRETFLKLNKTSKVSQDAAITASECFESVVPLNRTVPLQNFVWRWTRSIRIKSLGRSNIFWPREISIRKRIWVYDRCARTIDADAQPTLSPSDQRFLDHC